MNTEEKLAYILSQLKTVALPNKDIDSDRYWKEMEIRCDNATDEILDNDIFIKRLIKIIEEI